MAALARLIGLFEPKLLVRMSRMPAASQTARTAAPAITPVPGLAGTRMTRAAPKCPMMVCGMLVPCMAMVIMLREPSLTAFSTAGGTSLALP